MAAFRGERFARCTRALACAKVEMAKWAFRLIGGVAKNSGEFGVAARTQATPSAPRHRLSFEEEAARAIRPLRPHHGCFRPTSLTSTATLRALS